MAKSRVCQNVSGCQVLPLIICCATAAHFNCQTTSKGGSQCLHNSSRIFTPKCHNGCGGFVVIHRDVDRRSIGGISASFCCCTFCRKRHLCLSQISRTSPQQVDQDISPAGNNFPNSGPPEPLPASSARPLSMYYPNSRSTWTSSLQV